MPRYIDAWASSCPTRAGAKPHPGTAADGRIAGARRWSSVRRWRGAGAIAQRLGMLGEACGRSTRSPPGCGFDLEQPWPGDHSRIGHFALTAAALLRSAASLEIRATVAERRSRVSAARSGGQARIAAPSTIVSGRYPRTPLGCAVGEWTPTPAPGNDRKASVILPPRPGPGKQLDGVDYLVADRAWRSNSCGSPACRHPA